METAAWYESFGTAEARGKSRCYEQWALGVAADPLVLARIEELPEVKRQPNLVFAAARYVGIAPGPYATFRSDLLARWPEVSAVARTKRTQTNEPGRCAVLLPVLAGLPPPLALLEVGASAGLCLYPDRFSYDYGRGVVLDPAAGPGPRVTCAAAGPVPIPAALPEVVWRAGIDLNPLDVADPDDVRWLQTLIWPEHAHRRQRLAGAVSIARADPPHLVRGDLNEGIDELVEQAPAGATLVVFHTAVLAYLDHTARAAFVARVQDPAVEWISNEADGVLPFAPSDRAPAPAAQTVQTARTVLAHNGRPLAYADPHGEAVSWFA